MSPVSQLSILAFASTVLASPYAGHGHGHAHVHRHLHTGSGAPYPSGANSTGIYAPTASPKVPSYASPSSSGDDTLTSTITHQSTEYRTVFQYVTAQGSAAASNVQVAAASASDVCGADVTVTSTEKVYVTVTAGGASSSVAPAAVPYGSSSSVASVVQSSSSVASAPAYSAPAYSAPSSDSSSEAAPVSTSSSSAPSAPAYSAPAYTPSSVSSSVAAPATTSSSVAPVSSAPAYTPTTESSSSSSAMAILPSSYSLADKGSSPSTTASAPASYSSASSSGGKRGLAYNTASLLECFTGSSEVSWAYNWLSSAAGLSGYKYIPMLHSSSSDFTGSWSTDAQAAIDSGSTTLFSFNEPDISSQANMAPAAAAAAYKQYMNPFNGKASLCAPAVSNGDPSQGYGLGWLQSFLTACNGECNIDAYNIHWYGTDVEDLKNQTSKAIELAGGKPVWVSEFAINGLSDDEIDSFLKEIMPWFDSNAGVAGYAYFMAENGKLISGTEPSSYGSTYMSYTS